MRWGVWVNMNEQYSALRSNVSMLGKLLGDTIKDALGENILDRVETIRKLSKSSRAGNEADRQELLTTLQNLSNDELLPVARAFSQFLNLANTAEQYHSISPKGEGASNPEIISAYVDGSGTGLKFRNSAGLPAFRPSVSENKPPSRPLAKLISSILKLSGSKPLMSPTVLPSKSIHV